MIVRKLHGYSFHVSQDCGGEKPLKGRWMVDSTIKLEQEELVVKKIRHASNLLDEIANLLDEIGDHRLARNVDSATLDIASVRLALQTRLAKVKEGGR